ncbi:hypothetical protein [Kribbella sp. NPDC050459]|uniref:hypothetical protein n=1 Tax=Kribbella sp. NPDC050459 TaxID=3155785 RepID=UPI0033CFE987
MAASDLFEFDLVSAGGALRITDVAWTKIQFHLSEFQPAKSVRLIGDPPSAIRVLAFGGTEVAPGLLAKIEELAGTSLQLIPRGGLNPRPT